jgi:hypothetical protein
MRNCVCGLLLTSQHVGRPLATKRTRRPLVCGHDGWWSRCGALVGPSDCGCASLRRCVGTSPAMGRRRCIIESTQHCVAALLLPSGRCDDWPPARPLARLDSRTLWQAHIPDTPPARMQTWQCECWALGCMDACTLTLLPSHSRRVFRFCCVAATLAHGGTRCVATAHSPLRCLAASLRRRADTSLRCCHTQPLRCLAVAPACH